MVKEVILKGNEFVPEAYRQKFRNCKRVSGQTHVEFARIKEQLFDCWCLSRKVKTEFQNNDVKAFIDEKQVET
jgi:hypothetical protein